MKSYLLGIATVLLLFVIVLIPVNVLAQGNALIDHLKEPNTYAWYESANYTTDTVIKNVTSGQTIVGYYDPVTKQIPKYAYAIIIEFEDIPTVEELEMLDLELNTKGLKRDGGITISDKLNELTPSIGK